MNENYYKNMPEDFRKAVAVIKGYCQNEECAADCECDECPYPLSMNTMDQKINIVTVRWFDGYKEDFRCTEIRFGSDLLWMRLENGTNRHIPLRQVRWFGTSIESHQSTGM